jgi:actin-related protein
LVLAGGNTEFLGLDERLAVELGDGPEGAGAPPSVVGLPLGARRGAAWRGGAVVAALSSFAPAWITRAEYDEAGPAIVRTKGL